MLKKYGFPGYQLYHSGRAQALEHRVWLLLRAGFLSLSMFSNVAVDRSLDEVHQCCFPLKWIPSWVAWSKTSLKSTVWVYKSLDFLQNQICSLRRLGGKTSQKELYLDFGHLCWARCIQSGRPGWRSSWRRRRRWSPRSTSPGCWTPGPCRRTLKSIIQPEYYYVPRLYLFGPVFANDCTVMPIYSFIRGANHWFKLS